MHRVARLILMLWGMGSAAAFGTVLYWIATDPAARAFRDATLSEISVTTDRMLARTATPTQMAALIASRLDQDPRNWLALDALLYTATHTAVALPPDLSIRLTSLREQDHGYLATAGSCAYCVYDATSCSLTEVFICQAPIILTPVGDLIGVARAGTGYLLGNTIDKMDLALSIVGLGATVIILPCPSCGAVIKAGAGLLKVAVKMGRVSRPLRAVFERAIRDGVIWTKLPSVRSMDDLWAALRMEHFNEVTRVANALGDVVGKTDLTTALHVLPLVNTAHDAERLALSAQALGPRFLGAVEILGKTRLFRAMLRLTDLTLSLAASFLAFAAGMANLIGVILQGTARLLLRSIAARLWPVT